MREVELLIVGQGLAGTTLAWEATRRGLSVVVIDDGKSVTASRIAAGLVTPISGQRLTLLPDYVEYWKDAEDLYRNIEQQLEARFWHVQSALRIWKSESELQKYGSLLELNLRSFVGARYPPHAWPTFNDPWGSFEMLTAARLDVGTLLSKSRQFWMDCQRLLELEFHPSQIDSKLGWFELPILQIRSRRLALCTGAWTCLGHESFHEHCLRPNQGDILRIRCPALREDRTVHSGIWIAPATNDEFLMGATYRWEKDFSALPRLVDRDLLVERCSHMLRVPFDVIDHQTALRPASLDQRPVLGCLDSSQRIAVLNGLGSRGSLQAPRCAKLLLDFMFNEQPIPPELRWDRAFPTRGTR